jgi:hypothetical protein
MSYLDGTYVLAETNLSPSNLLSALRVSRPRHTCPSATECKSDLPSHVRDQGPPAQTRRPDSRRAAKCTAKRVIDLDQHIGELHAADLATAERETAPLHFGSSRPIRVRGAIADLSRMKGGSR